LRGVNGALRAVSRPFRAALPPDRPPDPTRTRAALYGPFEEGPGRGHPPGVGAAAPPVQAELLTARLESNSSMARNDRRRKKINLEQQHRSTTESMSNE